MTNRTKDRIFCDEESTQRYETVGMESKMEFSQQLKSHVAFYEAVRNIRVETSHLILLF